MIKYVNSITLAACIFSSGLVHADSIQGVNIAFETIGSPGFGAPGSLGHVNYSYRIGKHEVSVSQFLASGIVSQDANGPDRWGVSGSGMPAVHLNWHEAAMYCNFLTSGSTNSGAYTVSGGRVTGVMSRTDILNDGGMFYLLPTEDEWYKAAYFNGSGFSLYANGTSVDPVDGLDSLYGRHEDTGTWTTVEGNLEQNKTFNMMGNVWEWLETSEDGMLDFDPSEKMVFRGGDYFQGLELLKSSEIGLSEQPEKAFKNTGLRVVSIPEPGSITLLSISIFGLFAVRRIRRRNRFGSSLVSVRCDSFCSEEEWYANEVKESVDFNWLGKLKGSLIARGARVLCCLRNAYGSSEKIFWNWVVAVYDRRGVRPHSFQKSFKKKLLNGFDAFLALIMK